MQEYVLVHCRDRTHPENILIVLKHRPAWQAGLLNLPGGKSEPGETPEQAAIRELQEETGYLPNFRYGTDGPLYMEKCGEIRFDGGVIHCMSTILTTAVQGPPKPRDGETEPVEWVSWGILADDPRLIPNLQVIIPLMDKGLRDWVVTDNESSAGKTRHTISISVATHPNPTQFMPIS